MEYFEYTYKDITYEFKPNRKAQAKIEQVQLNNRKAVPGMGKQGAKLTNKVEILMKKVDNAQKELEKLKEEGADEETLSKKEEEYEPILEELNLSLAEAKEFTDNFDLDGFDSLNEQIMYIVLSEQRTSENKKRYPNLTRELFDEICENIAQEYGLEEYNEICEAVKQDVFTTSGSAQKAEPKSSYLRNRKNKK